MKGNAPGTIIYRMDFSPFIDILDDFPLLTCNVALDHSGS